MGTGQVSLPGSLDLYADVVDVRSLQIIHNRRTSGDWELKAPGQKKCRFK